MAFLNMNFNLEILTNLEFGSIKFVNKLFIKLLYFIHIFNQKQDGKADMTSFSKQLVQRSQKNSQPTKINWTLPLVMDFNLNGKD